MRVPLIRQVALAALAFAPLTAVATAGYRYLVQPRELVAMTAQQFFPRQAPQSRYATPDEPGHSFYFTRAIYTGYRGSWATDYPKADQQFLAVLTRLTGIDAFEMDHAVRLDDPELRRFPFVYAVEVGDMELSPAEIEGLRGYLLAGGFLAVDDFWGTAQWRQFERQIMNVLPEFEIVDIPLENEIFRAFYDIQQIIQVPNVGQGESGGPTYERDGYDPHFRGIYDERGRLMVVINWNTDLGDGWEWAERPMYPLEYSTYAYQMGANFIMYSMTH